MTQAVARIAPTVATVLENPGSWTTLKDVAAVMFAGGGSLGVLPAVFKNPQQVQAGMLVLMGMGEDPIAGLQHVHPLPGNKIGFDYKFLMGVVEKNAPEFRWHTDEESATVVRGWFQRSEKHEKYFLNFTIEQAKKAGLIKAGSNWESRPDVMLFKTWWLTGTRRVAPAAMRGIPVQYDSESDDESEVEQQPGGERGPERQPLGARVDAAFTKSESRAEPVEDEKPEPERPKREPDPNWQELFLQRAKAAGITANAKKGAALWEKVRGVLEELLTEAGVRPNIRSPQELPSADWRLAYERLCERYDESGKYIGKKNGAGTGTGTTPAVPAATEAEPAPEPEDEPPAATGEPQAAAQADSQGDDNPEADQLSDPAYLLELGRSLELAWKEPQSVVKEAPPGSGKWWFVNRDILLRCGYKTDTGAAQTKALFQSVKPEYNLEPREVFALVTQVNEELTKAQAKRRK